ATLAIAGLPGLSGYFSKDEILFKAFAYGYDGHPLLGYGVWIVGLITAVLTAIYMTRAYLLTFEGDPRWPDAMDTHPHESPWTMTTPLWVLGGLSVFGGLLGLPPVVAELFGTESWIHHWLGSSYGGPVAEKVKDVTPSHAIEWALLGLGGLIAIGGIATAWLGLRFARRGPDADRSVRKTMGWLYRIADGKWYWDEAYAAAIIKPVVEGSRKVFAPFDKKVVDGGVMGIAGLVRGAASRLRGIQTGVVQTYAFAIVLGVVAVVAAVLFA
ncbi:MAG: NADH-quinone oxidoreductase subunit L, partial [Bacteroidota bacterium]